MSNSARLIQEPKREMSPEFASVEGTVPSSRITTAGPPFNKDTADAVLRTSDNVEFHVWKGILIEASPVFADMFEISGNSQHVSLSGGDDPSARTSLPSVTILEPSTVIDTLLRTCYPLPRPTFASLDTLKPVLAAAHKYQMEGVLELLKEELSKHAHLAPLRVYVIAMRFDRPDAAGVAARHFLAQTPADEYVSELEDCSAGTYHRLLAYRKQCAQALADMVASNLSWLIDGAWQPFLTCSCPAQPFAVTLRDSDVLRTPRVWFWQHYQRMGALLAERPCRAAIEDPTLTDRAVKEASACGNCRTLVHEGLHSFTSQLKSEIDRRIAQASEK